MEEFKIKTTVLFGADALQWIASAKMERVLVITDPYMVESGMVNRVTDRLSGKEYRVFSHVAPDPPMDLVAEGVQEVLDFLPRAVVALGGGSAIDEAKAIMHFAREIGTLPDMEFIAVPTTSGTGSEVTSFAVITDPEKGVKYPLVDEGLLPDTAILDASLVKSVPSGIAADTGMDVLTHALEAYVSVKASAFTDAMAEKAACMVFQYLYRSWKNPDDTEAREQMHYASCLAGMAFNQASLGVNHAIAHNVGGKFRIAHGRTNAILLPFAVEFNAQLKDFNQKEFGKAARKYAKIATLAGFGGVNVRAGVKNLIHQIQKLQKEMGMPVTFRDCKIKADAFRGKEREIAAGALADTCILTNPVPVAEQDILGILKKAW